MALGLGDIRVLSRPGQPLVAEIPVISNEPGELENARVALASPATFQRVGLDPPQGLVNELQFQFTQDARGQAVIRVTSNTPVDQKAIGFLIEVDWGQGRLVREYSALVDAPNTAAAIAEPVIEAPAVAADNQIVREPEPLPAAPVAEPPSPVPASAAASPAPVAAPAPPRATAPTLAPGDSLTVRNGQTLSGIAAGLARNGGQSLDQTMIALLRANPDAFIGGNINRLKAGAVLRTPEQDELARVGAAEATAMVREQAAQWRQARAPVPQPAEAGAASTPASAAATPAGTHTSAAPDGARLEIAPAVASDAKNAGTTSGTGAGGEGDMAANEQLQQAHEDVATRDAEIQELRTRVGELEKLQQQQQKLIALKDSDLAAAQQRLSQSQQESGAGAAAMPMWLWGGLALVIAGLIAWLAARRRKPSPLPPLPRHGFDAAALTAAVPTAAAATSVGEREIDREVELEEVDLREEEHSTWHAPAEDLARVVPEPAAPAWHAGAGAPLNPAPAGRDRLELAVAYLDLGDTETARSLLNEVAQGQDPDARAEAVALLSQLR